MYFEQILLGIFAIINVTAFVITGNDKRKSIHGGNADRTPEGLLFFLAAAFGATGVYAAMQLFRHKTRKWYFQLGIPLLIIQNGVVVYLVVGILS